MERVLETVEPKVTPDMNRKLLRPYTGEEVKQALFQMYPTKSPGHDGLPALFYQQYWHVVGDEVSKLCVSVLHGEKSVKEFNHTLIALIPKVKQPKRVTEFRPISLCTVIYKIIVKTFANRLKQVLPSLISETQSAFVPRRSIHDNVMIAFETLHSMKCLQQRQPVKMAVKLDMAKAYDLVEWVFYVK